MSNSLQFLVNIYILSIFIHIIALAIALVTFIPLQIKEAQVQNGLAKLRKLMLASGLIVVTLSVVSIIVLSLRFFISNGDIIRYTTVSLVLFHSLGFLGFALVKREMYRQQFTDVNKRHHEKIARIEERENREAQ